MAASQKSRVISQGDCIEANVNEQNLAISIRSAQGREVGRANESSRMPDSTIELHESPRVQRTQRCQCEGSSGREDRAPDGCIGENHHDQHLRIRSAHV